MVRLKSLFIPRSVVVPSLAVTALWSCGAVDGLDPMVESGTGGGPSVSPDGSGGDGEGGTETSGGTAGVGAQAGTGGAGTAGALGLGGAWTLPEEWGLDPDMPDVEPEGVFELVDTSGNVPNFPRAIELRLIDGEISFSGGCNEHWGEYSFDGQTLQTSDSWASTQAGCDMPRMVVDSFLSRFFADAPSASGHGERMVLATSDAALLFDRTEEAHPDWPLLGTYWNVSKWTDPSQEPPATKDLYGNFILRDNGEFDVLEGCVYIEGTYQESPDGFSILSVELDDEECEEHDPTQSRDVLAEFFAPGEVTTSIVDRHLYLTRDGRELYCPPPR